MDKLTERIYEAAGFSFDPGSTTGQHVGLRKYLELKNTQPEIASMIEENQWTISESDAFELHTYEGKPYLFLRTDMGNFIRWYPLQLSPADRQMILDRAQTAAERNWFHYLGKLSIGWVLLYLYPLSGAVVATLGWMSVHVSPVIGGTLIAGGILLVMIAPVYSWWHRRKLRNDLAGVKLSAIPRPQPA